MKSNPKLTWISDAPGFIPHHDLFLLVEEDGQTTSLKHVEGHLSRPIVTLDLPLVELAVDPTYEAVLALDFVRPKNRLTSAQVFDGLSFDSPPDPLK